MKENRISKFGIRQLSIAGSCFFHTKNQRRTRQ
nr:MAG TPA_asm: hypothetical protein [Caudoviricetes sp.]